MVAEPNKYHCRQLKSLGDNIRALGSEYTSSPWDDRVSGGWGYFVFEAYKDIKSSEVGGGSGGIEYSIVIAKRIKAGCIIVAHTRQAETQPLFQEAWRIIETAIVLKDDDL